MDIPSRQVVSSDTPPSIVSPRSQPGRAAWLQVVRVESLAVSTVSVLAGGAAALYAGYAGWLWVPAWVGAVAAQAGTNLLNVSYNYKAGQQAGATHVPDPRASSAVVWSGRLGAGQVRRAALVCFGVAIVAGLVLVAARGWPIVTMGLAGLAAGASYSAPPVRLAHRGLGVATVFLFMGPVMVLGTAFAVSGTWIPAAAWVAVPVGVTAAGIMHLNDLRDYEDDLAHGKRTLSARIGRRYAAWLLAGALILAFGLPLVGAAAGRLPWSVVMVLLVLPLAWRQVRGVFAMPDAGRLRAAWMQAVRLHTVFGVLLSAALVLGALP